MEVVSCDLCGSSDYREVYRMPDILFHRDEWFLVVECAQCGLGFVNPRPTRQEIGKYYPDAFFDFFDEAWHQARYRREAEYLADLCRPGARLLDIGCANGDFPRLMRQRGWDVTGVEIGEQARKIDDFVVHRCEFPDAPLPESHFDAVTAWAVMEHVHQPSRYFRRAAQVLRPAGRFVFLVPNFASWGSRFLYREDLPRHLHFFTEETVKRYLDSVGLRLIGAEFTNEIYEMRPVNWLRCAWYRQVLKRHLPWTELPERPAAYFERIGRSDLTAKFAYVLGNPLTVIDRLLMPLFEAFGPKRLTHGVVVYSAVKT